MPSSRPRLVEEGKPIMDSPFHDRQHHHHHNMDHPIPRQHDMNVEVDEEYHRSHQKFLDRECRKAMESVIENRSPHHQPASNGSNRNKKFHYEIPVPRNKDSSTTYSLVSHDIQSSLTHAATLGCHQHQCNNYLTKDEYRPSIMQSNLSFASSSYNRYPSAQTSPMENATSAVFDHDNYEMTIDHYEDSAPPTNTNINSRNNLFFSPSSSSAMNSSIQHPGPSVMTTDHHRTDPSLFYSSHDHRGRGEGAVATHYYIVGDHHSEHPDHAHINRMEVEDILTKPPLIILDGANISYSYAESTIRTSTQDSNILLETSTIRNYVHINRRKQPDVRGIEVAVDYFLRAQCRVQVVVPVAWVKSKPRNGSPYDRGFLVDTNQREILNSLQKKNLLCYTPPTDDDDAYALAIARREDSRARLRRFNRCDGGPTGGAYLEGGAFVVSNDLFRDAIERDGGRHGLRQWLEGVTGEVGSQPGSFGPPGRISFSFCDLGSIDAYGSAQLDFVPNPRHPLIEWIECVHRKAPGKL